MREIIKSKKANDLIDDVVGSTISYCNRVGSSKEFEKAREKLYKYIAKLEGDKERYEPNSKGIMVETVGGKWRKA